MLVENLLVEIGIEELLLKVFCKFVELFVENLIVEFVSLELVY